MNINVSSKFEIREEVYFLYESDNSYKRIGDEYCKVPQWYVAAKKHKIKNIRYDFLHKKFTYLIKESWVDEDDIFKDYNLATAEESYRNSRENN